MRKFSLRELINKYIWHPDLDISKLKIRYIDRPRGVSEINGNEIVDVGHKFLYTIDIILPYHRIVEISYENEVIWRKPNYEKIKRDG